VYYAASHRLDALHARRLRGLAGVTHVELPSARHDVVRELRDSGRLLDILVEAAHPQ
jgi:hypothetical protein